MKARVFLLLLGLNLFGRCLEPLAFAGPYFTSDYVDSGSCRTFAGYCGAGAVRSFSAWGPPPIPNPPIVWTCVNVAYLSDASGNPVGTIDPKSASCCQGPRYSQPQSGADQCGCWPSTCLTQWYIEAGATAAFDLDQALNMAWQHSIRDAPTVLNSPGPSPSPKSGATVRPDELTGRSTSVLTFPGGSQSRTTSARPRASPTAPSRR